MIFKKYTEDMFDAVNELVKECVSEPMVKNAGGYGIVYEDEGKIDGFVWALTSEDSPIAYIDWFCVRDGKRRQGLGLALITDMICYLKSKGKTRVVGVVVDISLLSVANIYRQGGMDVRPGFAVGGNPDTIIEKLKEIKHGRK